MYAGLGQLDAAGAGEGAWQGVSAGGAASSLLIITPLAPVAIVAPVLGALVGGLIGGLSGSSGGMADDDKKALGAPIASLTVSIEASDNPFVLDAMQDAADRMLDALGAFVVDSGPALNVEDEKLLSAWTTTLTAARATAKQKAVDLRAAGKTGTPLPPGSKQAALDAEIVAIHAASVAAADRVSKRKTAKWIAYGSATAIAVGGAWWWLKRSKKKASGQVQK